MKEEILDMNPPCVLINGNSFEVLKDMDFRNDKIVVVTDPPFNVGYHYDEYKDKMKEDEYVEKMCCIFERFPSVVIHYPEDLYRFAIALNEVPKRVVSWIYNSNTAKQHRDIAYFDIVPNFSNLGEYKNPKDKRIMKRIADGKRPRGYDWIYSDQIKNVSKEKTEHPCQMPLEVMTYVMKTLPKDITVLDPFAGSGTTLLAARNTGLGSIGIEISEKYCDIIRKRIRDSEAPKPRFIQTEMTF